jgi:hypothetical protein
LPAGGLLEFEESGLLLLEGALLAVLAEWLLAFSLVVAPAVLAVCAFVV